MSSFETMNFALENPPSRQPVEIEQAGDTRIVKPIRYDGTERVKPTIDATLLYGAGEAVTADKLGAPVRDPVDVAEGRFRKEAAEREMFEGLLQPEPATGEQQNAALTPTLLRLIKVLLTSFRDFRAATADLAAYEHRQFAGTPEYAEGHAKLAWRLHMARRALETSIASAQHCVDLFTPKPKEAE